MLRSINPSAACHALIVRVLSNSLRALSFSGALFELTQPPLPEMGTGSATGQGSQEAGEEEPPQAKGKCGAARH